MLNVGAGDYGFKFDLFVVGRRFGRGFDAVRSCPLPNIPTVAHVQEHLVRRLCAARYCQADCHTEQSEPAQQRLQCPFASRVCSCLNNDPPLVCLSSYPASLQQQSDDDDRSLNDVSKSLRETQNCDDRVQRAQEKGTGERAEVNPPTPRRRERRQSPPQQWWAATADFPYLELPPWNNRLAAIQRYPRITH